MNTDESLSEVFGVTPTEKPTYELSQIVETSEDKIESDYDLTRSNLQTLLTTGQDALLKALEIAKQSEHPRAFEVVGNLIKQLADVNQQLMDLHQQKQKLEEPSKKAEGTVTNNNAIFVGSTADLNNIIKKLTKGE